MERKVPRTEGEEPRMKRERPKLKGRGTEDGWEGQVWRNGETAEKESWMEEEGLRKRGGAKVVGEGFRQKCKS